jgi:hypothetical protein
MIRKSAKRFSGKIMLNQESTLEKDESPGARRGFHLAKARESVRRACCFLSMISSY